jgi:hypothetical protein
MSAHQFSPLGKSQRTIGAHQISHDLVFFYKQEFAVSYLTYCFVLLLRILTDALLRLNFSWHSYC